jgi:DNA-binding IclR family transcriptional regulator
VKCPHCGGVIEVRGQTATLEALREVLETSVAAAGRGGWASTAQVSRQLGLTRETTWSMLRTLERQGAVESKMRTASSVRGVHRLWRLAMSRDAR